MILRPFAVTGIISFLVLALLYDEKGSVAIWGLVIFTIALVISLIIKPVRRQSVFPIAFGAACLACLLLVCVNEFYYYPQMTLANSNHKATVLITSNVESKNGNYYYEGKTTCIDEQKNKVKMRIVFVTPPELEPYDSIEGNFYFYELGSSSEESLASYKSENLFLGGKITDENYNILHNTDKTKPFGYYVLQFRNLVKKSIMSILPNDYGALCLALVLGDRSALSTQAYNNLRDCGITHIICVSGLHLSIWSTAFLWLFRKLKFGEKLSYAATIPVVIFLMLASGMTYSIIRSGIMMLLFLASNLVLRRPNSLNSLGFAITVILCFNPYAAGSLSLQLSALSTLGIILYSEFYGYKVSKFLSQNKVIAIFEKPIKILIISAVATGFCLPVTLRTFGSFNFAVFPANLLVITVAEICMICSVLGAFFGAISLNIFNLPGLIAGLSAKYILKISEILSKLKWLNVHISQYEAYLALAVIFMFCALMVLISYTGKKVVPIAPIMVGFILVSSLLFFNFRNGQTTQIRVIDVGQGQAVLVSEKGQNILIGVGGSEYDSAYAISQSIDSAGGNLTAIIIPENTDEFTSNFYSIAKKYSPQKIYTPSDFSFLGLDQKTIKNDMLPTIKFDNIELKTDENDNIFLCSNGINTLVYTNPSVFNESDFSNCNVAIFNGGYPPIMNCENLYLAVVSADNQKGCNVQNSLISQGVRATATAQNGSILITCHDGYVYAERY